MNENNNMPTVNKSKIIIGTALGWASIHIITMVVRSLKLGVNSIFTISPITVLVCLLLCYALKKGLPAKWAATILLINISIPLMMFAYHSGGFKGPVIYLMSVLPLMAFLLINKRAGWLFCSLTISTFVTFAYLNYSNYPLPEPKVEGGALYIARAVSISFLVFLISWIGWLYQNTYQQFINSINQKNQELVIRDQYKSNFISHISHEFRTPLNAIIGFSKKLLSLKADQANSRETEALKAINRSGKNLLSMVNNSLDIAQIESGKLSLSTSPQNIAQLINEAASDIRVLAEQKNLAIHIAPYTPQLTVNADPYKIKQVFNNIIANAIKYTEQGSIDIIMDSYTQQATDKQPQRDYATITIADTGVGIEQDEMGQLFNRFTRLKKHESSAIDGAGLGLSIANELVRLHQGHIDITSTVGVGSRFTIVLPLISNSREQSC